MTPLPRHVGSPITNLVHCELCHKSGGGLERSILLDSNLRVADEKLLCGGCRRRERFVPKFGRQVGEAA